MAKSKDKEQIIQEGPGPFGTRYFSKEKRGVKVEGKGIFAGKVSELPAGTQKCIPYNKFNISFFNIDGEFYAIKEACPHAQYPLTLGDIHPGPIVSCASHNWQFELKTGKCVRGNKAMDIRTFAVRVDGDEVWVEV